MQSRRASDIGLEAEKILPCALVAVVDHLL
jgi:hypothetical protein